MVHKPEVVPLSPLRDLICRPLRLADHDVRPGQPGGDLADELADRCAFLKRRAGYEAVVLAVRGPEDLHRHHPGFRPTVEVREAGAGVQFGIVGLLLPARGTFELLLRAGMEVDVAGVEVAPDVFVHDGFFEVRVAEFGIPLVICRG